MGLTGKANLPGRLERWDRLCAAGVGAAWLVLLCYAAWYRVRPWPDILLHIDFSSFWMAASLLRDGLGARLFDTATQYNFELNLRHQLAITDLIQSDTGYNPYPNLPALALLYVPLTYLPIPFAYVLWWGINFASFVAGISLSLRSRMFGRTIAVVMLSVVAVTTSLFEGQPYGLFLLLLTLALLALRSDRHLLGGLLLGMLWLKPQYAVLFPVVFLLKGRWRELAGTIVSGAFVGGLSLALVGLDGVAGFFRLLQEIGGFSYQWVDPWAMVNWRSLLMNLWPSISDETGSVLVLVLGAATVLVSLFVWRGDWAPASPKFPLQMLVTVLAVIVASPHSHIHGTVFLLPLVGLSMPTEDEEPLGKPWVAFLLLGYALSLATWPFGAQRWIVTPYLLVAMGILIVQSRSVAWLRRMPLVRATS
jgi:hypothetical protein